MKTRLFIDFLHISGATTARDSLLDLSFASGHLLSHTYDGHYFVGSIKCSYGVPGNMTYG
jgi:hypothetical protein